MTYSEKLRSPDWQRKRLELLSHANFTCQACLSTDKELHVHHRVYLRNTDPWDYPDFAYEVLCKDCHSHAQDAMERAHMAIAKYRELEAACSWVWGLPDKDAATMAEALSCISSKVDCLAVPFAQTVLAMEKFGHACAGFASRRMSESTDTK